MGKPLKRGVAFFGKHYRLPKGPVKIKFWAVLNPGPEDESHFDPKAPAIQVRFGKDCKKTFRLKHLSTKPGKELSLECEIPGSMGRKFELYWFGKLPVLVGGIELSNPTVSQKTK